MRYLLDEALAAWGLSLFLYFVMLMLVVSYGESAFVYWTLWAVFIAGSAIITFKVANSSPQTVGPVVFFMLAGAAALIVGFLLDSTHSKVMAEWIRLAAFGIVGIPS